MIEKLKIWIVTMIQFLVHLYSTDEKPVQGIRAYFIAWVVESAVGLLIFAIMFGTIAMPQFLAVSTAGWGTYAPLLWALIPLLCIAAYIVRIIQSARAGYVGPISGASW